ncbi:MAG: magnesium/cobalt transporter CorA [Thermodesulfobacteriota bacterium]|nr:magnesium/cobalt transporter CorA [Thermodesulfobacteriota bacterium]
MPRFIKRTSKKAGLAPGTLVHIGEKKVEAARVMVIDYDKERFQQKELKTVEECFPFKEAPTITWINIDGLHDIEIIEKIGKCFDIHPLTLEDIVNTAHRPKLEDFDDYVFVVLKMLHYDKESSSVKSEQVSLILCQHCLISFQEREGDVFSMVRERTKKGKGHIRKGGVDYLAYALIDAIVDHYFIILETFGEQIEELEEALVTSPTSEILESIHHMKKEMIYLRKQVWPLREVVAGLRRGEIALIRESTNIFLADVYDHTVHVIDTIESLRDVLSGMLDIYLSTVSNKMNEVMKVLTIMATIFIPLTFIAGVYGMNFKYMPELEWHWGYFGALSIMVGVAVFMVFYFKKKTWL